MEWPVYFRPNGLGELVCVCCHFPQQGIYHAGMEEAWPFAVLIGPVGRGWVWTFQSQLDGMLLYLLGCVDTAEVWLFGVLCVCYFFSMHSILLEPDGKPDTPNLFEWAIDDISEALSHFCEEFHVVRK
jgi:hypothetical protein